MNKKFKIKEDFMKKPDCRASLAMKFGRKARCIAFTMAEILLSLTIIGVVAAITLPSLTGNINERTWNTQRKALFARMNQAIGLLPYIRGYSDTEAFVDGLNTVLKINNICYKDNLKDCNFPEKFYGLQHKTTTQLADIDDMAKYYDHFTSLYLGGSANYFVGNAVTFETANNESILTYYYRGCKNEPDFPYKEGGNNWMIRDMCVNMLYDLNGKKGPNEYGKDIGIITVFNPFDTVIVSPILVPANKPNRTDFSTGYTTRSYCKSNVDELSHAGTLEEVAAVMINKRLLSPELAANTIYVTIRTNSTRIKPADGLEYFVHTDRATNILYSDALKGTDSYAAWWCVKEP